MIKTCVITLLAGLFLLPAALAFAEAPVVYSEKPELPPKTLRFEEDWRVGGEDGDLLFGMMVDSVEDADGNVYLLDNQLGQVSVISPDGEHLRTISGQGEGPGEVRMPQSLMLMPDGRIGILEAFPATVVTLDPDGTPGASITVRSRGNDGAQTGFTAAFSANCRNGTILIGGQHSTQTDVGQNRIQYMATISTDGGELVRYREAHMTLDFTQAHFIEGEMIPPFILANALDGAGRAYAARDHESYAIEVYEPGGLLERVVERKFQPRKRTSRETDRIHALCDAWMAGFPGEVERTLHKIEPSVADLHVDDENVLWVQHSRSSENRPDGVFVTYDTFTPDGKWKQEVAIRAEGDPAYDGIRFLSGDRVLLIRGYVLARWASRGAQNVDFGEDGEEAEAMEVICGRLVAD